eukprot:1157932-Pelagomonas_calceolata.AAC.6
MCGVSKAAAEAAAAQTQHASSTVIVPMSAPFDKLLGFHVRGQAGSVSGSWFQFYVPGSHDLNLQAPSAAWPILVCLPESEPVHR